MEQSFSSEMASAKHWQEQRPLQMSEQAQMTQPESCNLLLCASEFLGFVTQQK